MRRMLASLAVGLLLVAFAPSPGVAVSAAGAEQTAPAPAPFRIQKFSHYYDSEKALHIVGEVVNTLGKPVTRLEVNVNLYNAAGKVIRTEYAYSCIPVVGPKQLSPFDVVFQDPPKAKRFDVGATGHTTTAKPSSAHFEAPKSDTDTFVDRNGVYHVTARVTNTSNVNYKTVGVCLNIYNRAGKVIRSGYDYTEPLGLRPGRSGTFDWELFDYPKDEAAVTKFWFYGLR